MGMNPPQAPNTPGMPPQGPGQPQPQQAPRPQAPPQAQPGAQQPVRPPQPGQPMPPQQPGQAPPQAPRPQAPPQPQQAPTGATQAQVPPQPVPTSEPPKPKGPPPAVPSIDELLKLMLQRKASDLHIKVSRPPLLRISGKLVPTEFAPVDPARAKDLCYSMMKSAHIERYEMDHEIDFSYSLGNMARFRVNVFQQRGVVGGVLRMIPYKIPTVDQLGLPAVLKDLASKPRGLILVTGPTGSGKSTTLASLIDYINSTNPCHIVTVEDPIEFVYRDKMASINQRELGLDTLSLEQALKRVLRQDPDVILIGEMRDMATISIAVTAAETGHLVFSTLHTNDATQTIDRIIDTFPSSQQQQIRVQLAESLQGVVAQRLLKRKDGSGRVAAIEIMINSPTIKKLIEEGQTSKVEKAIEASVTYYRMQTFNQALVTLVKDGLVTVEEALQASSNPDEFKLNLKGIFSGSSLDNAQGNQKYDEF